MQKCKIVISNEVWCSITGLKPVMIEFLWNKFGVYVDGYRHMPAFVLGRWDGKIRFFERTGKTYVRLLELIIPLLENDYDIDLEDKRKYYESPKLDAKITKRDSSGIGIEATGLDIMGDFEYAPGKKFELRPYQLDSILCAIEEGSGFILAGTGAGKCISGETEITVKVSEALYNLLA